MAAPNPTPRFNPRGGDRRGPATPRPGLSLWYALGFILLLGLVQMYYLAPGGRPVPYSEFKSLLRNGSLAEVSVGDQTIRGTLKDSAVSVSSEPLQTITAAPASEYSPEEKRRFNDEFSKERIDISKEILSRAKMLGVYE